MNKTPEFLQVREILRRDWDPFGIGDNPNLATDYDEFVDRLLALVVAGVDEQRLDEEFQAIEASLRAPTSPEQRHIAAAAILKTGASGRNKD